MAGIGFSTDLDQRLQEIEIEANGAADDVCPLACGMCSKPRCMTQAFAAQPAGWCGPRFPKSRGSPAETPSYRVHRFTVIRSYDIYLKAQRGEGVAAAWLVGHSGQVPQGRMGHDPGHEDDVNVGAR